MRTCLPSRSRPLATTVFGALDLAAVAGDAEATFVYVPFAGLLYDFRVDEGDDLFVGYAYDDDTEGNPYLGSGDADAIVFVHALYHILGELLDVGVDGADALGPQAQDGVGGDSKRKYGQGAPLGREG